MACRKAPLDVQMAALLSLIGTRNELGLCFRPNSHIFSAFLCPLSVPDSYPAPKMSTTTSPIQVERLPVKFSVFIQPAGTIHSVEAREEVNFDDNLYRAVFDSATTVLSHIAGTPLARAKILSMALIMHSHYVPATEAFAKRWGPDIPPTDAQISDYLTNSPPNVILASPADLEIGVSKSEVEVCWGTVNKESEQNEIFVPIDLAERLKLPSECRTTLSQHQRLLWHIAFTHELVHATLKHLFPNITTPKLPGGILGQGGEAGHQFEIMYFGSQLQAEWMKKDAKDANRMDRILRLLCKFKSQSYELVADLDSVKKILDSFTTNRIYTPVFGQAAPYQPHLYGRFRVGGRSSDEEEQDDSDPDAPEIDIVTGMQTAGLGLEVAGAQFRGCRLIMEPEY
ncbi:hypothetical protein FB451DRAFT_598965 [Mycena latifolia]|nr:hypothetical protein FB451DRAFT_598965 [Mycena latifolia]